MSKMKRLLSGMLAAMMLAGATAGFAENAGNATMPIQTQTEAAATGGEATVYTHDGRVTFIDGSCVDGIVPDASEAARVVQDSIEKLGGDERTQFEYWRTVEDTAGNRYYVFRQMYGGTTVSGGAVKVVTDRDGNMLGLVSSVESELPEAESSEGITAQEAEALVIEHLNAAGQPVPEILPGRSEKVILPVNLKLDMDSEEAKEESHYAWVVYSDNPTGSIDAGSDLPYLAHYVTLSGEYLYDLPCIIPGDEASATGYDAAYLFEFMESVPYEGDVKLGDGTTRHIEIDLMRDARTGMTYLGNLERRIVVADCYEFLYNDGHVVLEASADNAGWDDTCLLSLYNYCRAWDYYNAIGWKGGDGQGTPIMILKDFCDKNRNPIDNAAYAGKYYGWQIFLSSSINDFAQALDVLAHEFTHCVTGSVMTYNAYQNDYGAINEAISDIQGNLCEMMMGDTVDEAWNLGENSSRTVRSMSDPHRYGQPEYSWDLYYMPMVKEPTAVNDRGGVHTNSSLLNHLAYKLFQDGDMSLEDARAFWFAVDCAMVPGTDYAQLSELLPWVLKNLDMEQYSEPLTAAMDATRLSVDALPDSFDADRALVTLTLPEDEAFTDGNWALQIISVDVDALVQRVSDIREARGDCAKAKDEMKDLLFPKDDNAMGILEWAIGGIFHGDDEEDPTRKARVKTTVKGLSNWFGKYLGDCFYMSSGAAGQDGRTIRMVCKPGLAVPILYRMEIKGLSTSITSAGLAVRLFDEWLDVGKLFKGEQEIDQAMIDRIMNRITAALDSDETQTGSAPGVFGNLDILKNGLENLSRIKDEMFTEIVGGSVCDIPANGLEQISILDEEYLQMFQEITKTDE